MNIWCNAYHRSSSLIQGYLLYCKAFIASSFCFLTQFIRFQGLLFFDAISWILLLKKIYLVFFMTFLKFLQSSIALKDLYLFNLSLHSLFHHILKHLVILTFFENLKYYNPCIFFNDYFKVSFVRYVWSVNTTNIIHEFGNKFFFIFFLE